ncbi:MAG: hypothetical protein QT05_C0051G0022 [archaeon GW2011_AR13]|nr:MAG: hypothetical protein QT05_C0051G0022 [archaeon GW2011_AR13]
MPKTKIREITLVQDKGAFSIFKKQTADKSEYDFEGIQALRQLLSNEKARMLNVILIEEKTKNRIRHKPKIVIETITINLKI